MVTRITPERLYHIDGTLPHNGEIFVYGSNLSGRHGKGSALIAKQKYGAVQGRGIGFSGQSYGIPTKDENLQILEPYQIVFGIKEFVDFTYTHPDLKFFVTAIGCGLASRDPKGIAPLFSQAINCSFPNEWRKYVEY